MQQKTRKLIAITVVAAVLQACATLGGGSHPMSQQMLDAGAERLNRAEVIEHLAGRTQVWASGGAYFEPNGDVYVKWEGRIYPRREWSADDNGRVCISFPDQERRGAFRTTEIRSIPESATFSSSCSEYFRKDGEVWVVTTEIFGERQQTPGAVDSDVRDGNRLADLAWEEQI